MDRLRALWERSPRTVLIATVGAAVAALALVAGLLVGTIGGDEDQPGTPTSTAMSFAVLAGTTVTNTGPSVINGNLGGASPGSAITGFPPGIVHGIQHAADAVAQQAQTDLATAYHDAARRTPAMTLPQNLSGLTLTPGVYNQDSALRLTDTVTLDAEDDPRAVFILQTGSTLTTASNSAVVLINGAQSCNVFWQVGSSATLGSKSAFVGSILAFTSVSVQTGATVEGRVLARNSQIRLNSNTITRPTCDDAPSTTTLPTSKPPTTTTGPMTSGDTTTTRAGTTTRAPTRTAPTRTGSTTTPGTTTVPTTAAPTTTTSTIPTTPVPTTTTSTETSTTISPGLP